MPRFTPPKPVSRPDDASLWQRLKLFRRDMFRSQPERLYGAQLAELKTPLYNSYLANDPKLVKTVLDERPDDFPKANLIGRMLKPLLGSSVFVTNGDTWKQQRRIIDPAFEAGRLKSSFSGMQAAGYAAVERMPRGEVEIEFETAFLAADVIFRTLFSMPITQQRARDVFDAFKEYQRIQPLLSPLDLVKAPKWLPRKGRGEEHAARIRKLLTQLVHERADAIGAGRAPDDLATAIMTTPDPQTGKCFSREEMVDQVAIFFLAGHETSASALAWGLYCIARDIEVQDEILEEVEGVVGSGPIEFAHVPKLRFTRDVFREVLRLYPPVPMMVREASKSERFRDKKVAPGSLCIISPWHLQRHTKLWEHPDLFDPWRWQDEATRHCARDAYIPFSKGDRVCPGAGFAMMEGVFLLALMARSFRLTPTSQHPVPVAHLTVRAEDGIMLNLVPRADFGNAPAQIIGSQSPIPR